MEQVQIQNEILFNKRQKNNFLREIVTNNCENLSEAQETTLSKIIELGTPLVGTLLSVHSGDPADVWDDVLELCEKEYVEIHEARNGKLELHSSVQITQDERNILDTYQYLPPMICPPKILRKPTDSAYLTIKRDSVVLKNKELSNNLVLNHLNTLNQQQLRLSPNKYSLDNLPDDLKYSIGEVEELIGDKPFYMTWKYDFRGRTYACGYHINPQGTGYHKSKIHQATSEKLTKSGEYWLKVDIANNYGLDKLTYAKRLEWVEANLDNLEALVDSADEPELYLEGVRALRQGDTGYLISLDATASGPQIMGILTGCKETMKLTNISGSRKRYDLYTEVFNEFLAKAKKQGLSVDSVDRKVIKNILMPMFYGSTNTPKEYFGDGTPELALFQEVFNKMLTGVSSVLGLLKHTWNQSGVQKWTLPDGFEVLSQSKEQQWFQFDTEIGDESYSFEFCKTFDSAPKRGISNGANVVHSIDGYIIRELVRRVNYDPSKIVDAIRLLEANLDVESGVSRIRNNIVSFQHIYELNSHNVADYTKDEKLRLLALCKQCEAYNPFTLVPIHDCMRIHPNNAQVIRELYKNILVDIAQSTLLEDIVHQINGDEVTISKDVNAVVEAIKASSYAIC